MKYIIILFIFLFSLQAASFAQTYGEGSAGYGASEEAAIQVLSIAISSDKRSYKLGEPININVTLQNIDRSKRRRLFLSTGTLAFEIKEKSGTRKSRSFKFPEESVTLRRNAQAGGTLDIRSEFKEPGEYTISALYGGYTMEAPAIKVKESVSNSLTITVRP